MARPSLRERLAAKRAAEAGEQTETTEGHWYVLHTYSGYENKVKKTIESKVEARDLADRVYEIAVDGPGFVCGISDDRKHQSRDTRNNRRRASCRSGFTPRSWRFNARCRIYSARSIAA